MANLPALGHIDFVGRGNPEPSKFVLIPQNAAAEGGLISEQLIHTFELSNPKAVLSICGGALDFKMPSSQIEQVFNRGIVRAAKNTSAWIVTGGHDAGVMHYVGEACKKQMVELPRIGIAAYKKVTQFETITAGEKVRYIQQKASSNHSAALNANHSHFILVDSVNDQWGEEIPVRVALEDYVSRDLQAPVVLIVVNGGPGTIHTVADAVKKGFQVIVVDGSGRAADAIAKMIEGDDELWHHLTKDTDIKDCHKQILTHKEYITIYNPFEDVTEDMDLVILRAVLSGSKQCDTFEKKVLLGVEWGRTEIIRELLESDDEIESSAVNNEVLNSAMQRALEHDQPEIFRLLVEKGADKSQINMKALYQLEDVRYLMERLLPYATHVKRIFSKEPEISAEKFADASLAVHRNYYSTAETHVDYSKQLDTAKKVLNKIHSMYYQLLANGLTSFTDMLVWAIMVNRHDLAKEIWRNSVLPVHSALAAVHLYKTLAEWFQGDDDYTACADWFEGQAVKVLGAMDYDIAKKVLEWQWTDLQNKNSLQIAEIAEAKEFMSHQYIQRFLDEVLYSDVHGKLTVGINTLSVISLIVFPFRGVYKHNSEKARRFYHVYHLPIVKFWSSTLSYIGYLILLGAVVIQSGQDNFAISEFILWGWILGTLVEEVRQFLMNKEGYFRVISNQVDSVMLVLLMLYIAVRIVAAVLNQHALVEISTDLLIVGTIWCYIRLLYVFAFSKTLGPLFFVMLRMNKDIAKWIFVFAVFMISFQLAVMALTEQAGQSMWLAYPNGSFAGTFFTIVGDFSNTMQIMSQTSIGVIILAVYAFIAQVVLVNLLIAMMGDTYSDVKEHSDKEWKFFRYSLVFDYCTYSPYPPPFNLIVGPIHFLFDKVIVPNTPGSSLVNSLYLQEEPDFVSMIPGDNTTDTVKEMKMAKARILESDDDGDSNTIQSVARSIRLLAKQREGDRIFLEQSLQSIQRELAKLHTKYH